VSDLGRVIILPDHDDMMRRLLAVCDLDHAIEHFYPRILRHAGKRKVATGVTLLLALAINDYCQDLPPVVSASFNGMVPEFLAALIDDEEAREEALEFWKLALVKSAQDH
jgi:hypothetical protein